MLNVNADDEDHVQHDDQTAEHGEQRHVQCEPVRRLAVGQLPLQLVVAVNVGGGGNRWRLVGLQRIGGRHRVGLVRLRALDVMGAGDGGHDCRIRGAFWWPNSDGNGENRASYRIWGCVDYLFAVHRPDWPSDRASWRWWPAGRADRRFGRAVALCSRRVASFERVQFLAMGVRLSPSEIFDAFVDCTNTP